MTLPLLALVSSWALSLGLTQVFLPHLRRLHLGQSIRTQGPEAHRTKAGTPTMGGLAFITAAIIVSFLFSPRTVPFWAVLAAALGFGFLGFLDDFLKTALKSPVGLRARYKFMGQLLLAAILVGVALETGNDRVVQVPFTRLAMDLGLAYPAMGVVAVVGTANAVNLTDGLDGLAAGTCTMAFLSYSIVARSLGYPDLSIIAAAMAGGLAGFLRFNHHPASVFMGDTGALALGGTLGALALFSQTELLLPIVGGVFVIETLSVMAQVVYFRLTGRRILRMSPLHHHFELEGHKEPSVVTGFWIAGAILGALGVLALRFHGV